MTTHILSYLLAGIAMLGMFYLPKLLNQRLLTTPIIYVLFGILIFNLPLDLPFINPEDNSFDRLVIEYVTELIVIISLAGLGIKIDHKPSLKNWRIGWYLLGGTMVLTIAALCGLGYFVLGLPIASAVLLGAVLAPTDPVLAGNVQVGPPNKGGEDHVRFGLTLEAGLNDGLAFPFVYLAIGLVGVSAYGAAITEWLWWDVAYRIAVGTGIGLLIGWVMSSVYFKGVEQLSKEKDTDIKEGLFMLAAILITYSLAEIAEGYGFLAVFVGAVASRRRNEESEVHSKNYAAIDQVEQAMLGVFLIAFGGILATGGLNDLTWPGALIGMSLVLIIRPLAGMISLYGCHELNYQQRIIISIFGIRGIGSIYYLAYAQNSTDGFAQIDPIWSIVNFTVLFSILIHGISVGPLLKWMESE